jgi:hypothetical protein
MGFVRRSWWETMSMEIRVPFDTDARERLEQALGPASDVEEVAALLARAGAREALALATGTGLEHWGPSILSNLLLAAGGDGVEGCRTSSRCYIQGSRCDGETNGQLERVGKLRGLITQNIDGLQQAAGSSPDTVLELHGTIHQARCLECGGITPMQEHLERVRAGELDPALWRVRGSSEI